MKKLLLILSAVFVSVMSWAQDNSTAGLAYTLNPYAYDLSSSWDVNTKKLTVRFKLNAPPNLDDNGTDNSGPYNKGIADKEPNGVQFYAVDQGGREYRIGGLGRNVIQAGINNGFFEYTMDLSAGTTHEFSGDAKTLPTNEPLTWKVRVKGRGNSTETYKIPRHVTARPSDFKRPRFVLGMAVGTNPMEPNFGRMFTTEVEDGSTSSSSSSTWYWLYNEALYDKYYKDTHVRMPAMLEYTPQLKFLTVHKKYVDDQTENSHFSTQKYSEPHRVRVSEDGRIFVSSYHQGAGAAVKEYLGNNTFRTVIGFDASENNDNQNSTGYPANSKYNRRAIDFDVKGSGDDLKIIVAWIKPKGSPATGDKTQWNTSIEIYEYEVGKNYDLHQTRGGTLVAKYTESNPSNHLCGYLFQAYYKSNYTAQRALVGVAYGSGENDIWLKVDPGLNNSDLLQGRIIYFNKQRGTNPQKETTIAQSERFDIAEYNGMPAGDYYGGGSIVVKDNKLYTYAAMTATGNAGKLRVYTIKSDGSLTKERDIALNVSAPWANGFAIDYANNLYMVSEWLGDIKTIALPYSGVVETPAPKGYEFMLTNDPKPNIYASHLHYAPDGTSDKYKFSFRTNTKPTYAELRFYKVKNVDNMNRNIETIHADDYDKYKHTTLPPDYVYTFDTRELRQGLMEKSLRMLGGDAEIREIEDALPPGELYWSVYVETDKSTFFAPIYRQKNTGDEAHYRLHATVNNHPATDMFGSIIVAQNDQRSSNKNSLMVYSINPQSQNNESSTNNTDRYSMDNQYYPQSNADFNKPRRMYVAPDGKVFIANEGEAPAGHPTTVATHSYGGIRVWDPQDPVQNGYLKTTLFSNNKINTSSAVALYKNNNGKWELHATNTYSEFAVHNVDEKNGYTEEEQEGKYAWNGLVKYNNLTINDKGIFTWTAGNYNDVATEYALGRGDASGNMSIAVMDQGVWMCQHREHNIEVKEAGLQSYPDNNESYILSFVPFGSTTKTWKSCSTYGKIKETTGYVNRYPKSALTQTPSSPLQSTPGGGMAYKKVKVGDNQYIEYIFVPNHNGDIVVLEITGWSYRGTNQAKPKVEYRKTLYTPASTKGTLIVYGKKITTSAITSMSFDYAGNLVTTTGVVYFDMNYTFDGGEPANVGAQDIIIYSMPYDRTNAQEIRASDNEIYIPERLHQIGMDEDDILDILEEHKTGGGACAIDLYRPLQGGMFNTICLPFELDMNHPGNPLAGAEVRQFTGAKIESINGEEILYLEFEEVERLRSNVPYIIKPETNIKKILRFNWAVTLSENILVDAITKSVVGGDNTVTYQGILPQKRVEASPLRLVLVADNRLAALTGSGDMYGFRGYFELAKPLPPGTVAKISAKKDTPTNTTIVVDGKKVNIEKYLREGRVYIRVGDSLYTIDGQVVE